MAVAVVMIVGVARRVVVLVRARVRMRMLAVAMAMPVAGDFFVGERSLMHDASQASSPSQCPAISSWSKSRWISARTGFTGL